MSDFRSRLERRMRQNLNKILDGVAEFERQGGFQRVAQDLGFDEIGGQLNPGAGDGQKTIRQYYANLEVPMGADLDTVKDSYRRLMRKYHPDKHADDPQMEELATQLSQELTVAYNAIESYLTTGRY